MKMTLVKFLIFWTIVCISAIFLMAPISGWILWLWLLIMALGGVILLKRWIRQKWSARINK
jgi:hypothetical protein